MRGHKYARPRNVIAILLAPILVGAGCGLIAPAVPPAIWGLTVHCGLTLGAGGNAPTPTTGGAIRVLVPPTGIPQTTSAYFSQQGDGYIHEHRRLGIRGIFLLSNALLFRGPWHGNTIPDPTRSGYYPIMRDGVPVQNNLGFVTEVGVTGDKEELSASIWDPIRNDDWYFGAIISNGGRLYAKRPGESFQSLFNVEHLPNGEAQFVCNTAEDFRLGGSGDPSAPYYVSLLRWVATFDAPVFNSFVTFIMHKNTVQAGGLLAHCGKRVTIRDSNNNPLTTNGEIEESVINGPGTGVYAIPQLLEHREPKYRNFSCN